MGLRKSVVITCEDFDYLELLQAIAASQAFETFYRHFAAARHKLNEFSPFAVVEFFKKFKEPFNHRSLGRVVPIHSVFFEVHN